MAYALVTGASRGIGRALSLLLAQRGYDLLLVARSEAQLQDLAREIGEKHQRQARVLALDLAAPGAAETVATWATQQTDQLAIMANNAGYGLWGRFEQLSLAEQQNMLQLNMHLPVALTHALLPALHRVPKAYVLNVASTAAYQAVPSLSLYAASKAFLLSFSRGLRYELKSSNISVTCLCPGATTTSFADRAGMGAELQATANKVSMTAEAVAEAAVVGLLAGEAEIIPGMLNKVSAGLTSVVPKGIVEKIAAGIYEKYL
ncbi:SDR family oxidoreductase [Hymenobacter sp. BT770]|uniref:SDR family NAD(P)-dependent oxidoreductase n=1 Tax=Hymenobacter sp. BT770 TaxID=2886942 RepID=UPI001D115888|nr:SDR family oxidoreductase [Hymenobacter sp. BT770]MCC3153769.1 SDR family oxidoreductase [Hymenobacter sp. BT770]MDO3416903.1 SDR family oxidoreductase [Hymenobacter sp. BT770]